MASSQVSASARSAALRTERAYVDGLYRRLDNERETAEAALTELFGRATAGTVQNRVEREVSVEEYRRRLLQLNAVDSDLCFGRTDEADGSTCYIGRLGLRDEDYEPLLVDWRAPIARHFYEATPSAPGPLVRRRHLITRRREVLDVNDEVFDLDGMREDDRRALAGEAALLASLRRGRTGRMHDVVATIQGEQDRVIRSGLPGVLVVQGGPGTGKTVAALHRAAYLLYTHRTVLERRGVLVIGPNATFLRYIGQVLPSLGETDVVLSTLGELFPGVRADTPEPDATVVAKGDPAMARLLAEAVRRKQRLPQGRSLRIELTVDNPRLAMTLRLSRKAVELARDAARGLHLPHNRARNHFIRSLLTALARDRGVQLDWPPQPEDLPEERAGLWEDPAVRTALDALWPELAPEQLLAELLADPGELRACAPALPEPQRVALLRRPEDFAGWTLADVPLLDELADLLGTDGAEDRAAARAAGGQRADEEDYALGVLQITGLDELRGMTSGLLADRQEDGGPPLSTAERAAADRDWAYGHVIVDEAQELSAMAWRMVMRRVPTRSMTVVGDTAQTGSPAGARSWSGMLDPYTRGRHREELLTVNYRTPAEIMDVAADVLAEAAPEEQAPESVREEGVRPRAVRCAPGHWAHAVAVACAEELAGLAAEGEGRLAVIVPDARTAEIAAAVPALVRGGAADPHARTDVLDAQAALLTVLQAKGLEFDRVVLADPAGILAQSAQGGHDLYVAITRATRRLTVVHEGELPSSLGRLARFGDGGGAGA